MASRYPEHSEIREEADSDNEVFLVHRRPDQSQECHVTDVTGIPGRPSRDKELDRETHDEINLSENTSREIIGADQSQVLEELRKQMADLRAFLVRRTSETNISQNDDGNAGNRRNAEMDQYQFTRGYYRDQDMYLLLSLFSI